jgi:hypothetical protein
MPGDPVGACEFSQARCPGVFVLSSPGCGDSAAALAAEAAMASASSGAVNAMVVFRSFMTMTPWFLFQSIASGIWVKSLQPACHVIFEVFFERKPNHVIAVESVI